MEFFVNLLPDQLKPYAPFVYGGIAIFAGLILLGLVWRAFSRRKKVDTADEIADFHLGLLAPAPVVERPPLLFEGQPVRLRFIAMAPPGRNMVLTADMAEGILQSIFYGLGPAFRVESPHVKVWPPQLSQTGFAPVFFRHVIRPEAPGAPSHWILLAGSARSAGRIVLLGMALEVAEPSLRGNVVMKIEQWSDKFRVLTVG
jgi:hypothetical protein